MKIANTRDKILQWLTEFKSACIMSSFGKDSMVMTHIAKEMGLRLPIVYHRNYWQPEKNKFADEITVKWGLHVHDWPPSECGVKVHDDCIQTVSKYQIGPIVGQVGPATGMNIPNGILEPEAEKPFICGRFDILERPKGTFAHPWDLMLQGQKNSDRDIFEGDCTLNTDLISFSDYPGSPAMAFPLREWDDKDIWRYIKENNVPVQEDRYDIENEREFDSKDANNDYVRACTRCIDRRQPATVFCPLLNKDIKNISSGVKDMEQKYAYIAS